MAIKGFRKPPQATPEGQALVNATGDFARQLENNPLLDGRFVNNALIGTSATNVSHLLGRDWIGWFVTSKNTTAVIYEGTQVNAGQYLTLIASAAAIVNIYVF